jgi:DHA1 family multidrug resistance protein-like MFS transporter
VLRMVHGVFTGVVTAIATLVSLTVPRQHLGTVLGLLQAAVYLGISLGPLLGGAFADRFGLRASFACTGVLLFATGLLVTTLVREPPRDPARADASGARSEPPKREPLFRRELIAVVLLMALSRFGQMAPQPFLPLFVQQLVDSPDGLATTVGIVLAATGIASTLSALLVGRLADRLGQRTLLIGSLLLSAVLSAAHVTVGSVWQLVVLRTMLGLAQGTTGPAIQALMIDVTPRGRRGAAFGLLTSANAAGNGGGPVIGSAVAAGFGIPAVFVATAPVYVLASWVVARITRRVHSSPAKAQDAAPSTP